MQDFNSANEGTKHKYFRVLKEARGQEPSTIDQTARAILEFERSTGFADFGSFTEEQAEEFKACLRNRKNEKTGKPLAAVSVRSKLLAVKTFFKWYLENLPRGVKIRRDAIEFLNPSNAETAMATNNATPKVIPTVEQIDRVLQTMPKETPAQRRDRAAICLLTLTGCRVGALVSIRMKHIDPVQKMLRLDAKEINTKFHKSFVAPFFPIGERFEVELLDWLEDLRTKHFFGPNDPVFPRLKVEPTKDKGFVSAGISREFLKGGATITKMIGQAFEKAGVPKTSAHRFRDMLVVFVRSSNLTMEQAQACSMALGHEDLSITFGNYGKLTPNQQVEVIGKMRESMLV